MPVSISGNVVDCDVWNIILPIVSLFLGKVRGRRVAIADGGRATGLVLFPIPKLGDGICCLVPPSSAWLMLVPYPLLSIARPQFQQYVLAGLKEYRKKANLLYEQYEQSFEDLLDWFRRSYCLLYPNLASDEKYDQYDELDEDYWLSYYTYEDEHDAEQDQLEEQYATAVAYSRAADRTATP